MSQSINNKKYFNLPFENKGFLYKIFENQESRVTASVQKKFERLQNISNHLNKLQIITPRKYSEIDLYRFKKDDPLLKTTGKVALYVATFFSAGFVALGLAGSYLYTQSKIKSEKKREICHLVEQLQSSVSDLQMQGYDTCRKISGKREIVTQKTPIKELKKLNNDGMYKKAMELVKDLEVEVITLKREVEKVINGTKPKEEGLISSPPDQGADLEEDSIVTFLHKQGYLLEGNPSISQTEYQKEIEYQKELDDQDTPFSALMSKATDLIEEIKSTHNILNDTHQRALTLGKQELYRERDVQLSDYDSPITEEQSVERGYAILRQFFQENRLQQEQLVKTDSKSQESANFLPLHELLDLL